MVPLYRCRVPLLVQCNMRSSCGILALFLLQATQSPSRILERKLIYALIELTTIQRTIAFLQNQAIVYQQLPLSLQLQFSSRGHLKFLRRQLSLVDLRQHPVSSTYPRKMLFLSRRIFIPGSSISVSVQTVYVSSTVSESSTLLLVSDATGLSYTSNTSAKTVPISAIVGRILGALVFVLLLGTLLIFLRRRWKNANSQTPFSPFESSGHKRQRGTAQMYTNFRFSNVLTGSDTAPTPFRMPYSDGLSSTASNGIPLTDRKDREAFDGAYDASHTISSSISPNSLPSPTGAAPFLRSNVPTFQRPTPHH